jgi:hypothetical protein
VKSSQGTPSLEALSKTPAPEILQKMDETVISVPAK